MGEGHRPVRARPRGGVRQREGAKRAGPGPRLIMEPRILIMTASYGEGHNAAAKALAAEFNEDAPGTALVVDVFALSCPRLNSLIRRAYLAAINGTPRLWKHLYAWMDRPGFMKRGTPFLRVQSRMLEEIIERN